MTAPPTASPSARSGARLGAPRSSGWFGGLDGLRAVAVALVVVYHLFPGALPGGFIGVDVFFAISGFLITSLLLREADRSGTIRLGRFWRRRARRLLPALGATLLVCTTAALAVGRDALVGIGGQLLGAAFFVSNWVYTATGVDYFAKDAPELFRNTWSLSIEEQFYVALPLLLLLLLRRAKRSTACALLFALGIASAIWMAVLAFSGAPPTRVYFGSDTHVFGLLLGAALALRLYRDERLGGAPVIIERQAQIRLLAISVGGLAVLLWLACVLREGSVESFAGGIQLATVAALAVVAAVTRPGAWLGRALDVAPLRWVGARSYGIYLWHWPVWVLGAELMGPEGRTGAGSWVLGLGALLITVACAALSYRYLELPVRALGLRRSVGLLIRPAQGTLRRRRIASAVLVLLFLTLPAVTIAVATAPSRSSSAEAILRGQEALRKKKPAPPPAAAASTQPVGGDITAVGDSVMLASSPELAARFPGISIDAEVSRGLGAGLGIVEDLAGRGELRRVLVVGLGTNGPVLDDDLARLRSVAGTRQLVLVNAHADRDWIPGVNADLQKFAAQHRGVVVADWNSAITPRPELLAGDGIHPEPEGGSRYADSVAKAIAALQQPDEAVGFGAPRR
ncbi:acyltransferase family protein [Leucobacter sp. HNU]|uniref:acyltransferase family protein n=1 Tax=Leucobacter sp. HNU TaxID=3236805 RepID=UPI003A80DF5E